MKSNSIGTQYRPDVPYSLLVVSFSRYDEAQLLIESGNGIIDVISNALVNSVDIYENGIDKYTSGIRMFWKFFENSPMKNIPMNTQKLL